MTSHLDLRPVSSWPLHTSLTKLRRLRRKCVRKGGSPPVVCSHCNDCRSERRFLRTASRPRAYGPSRVFGGVPRGRCRALCPRRLAYLSAGRASVREHTTRAGAVGRVAEVLLVLTDVHPKSSGGARTHDSRSRARPALASLSHCSDPALSTGPTAPEVVFAHEARAAIPVCRPPKGTPRETSVHSRKGMAHPLVDTRAPGP